MVRKASTVLCSIIFCLCLGQIHAQTTDLFRLEYTYLPNGNSENTFQRFRTILQAPIPIKEDYLVLGFQYRYHSLEFKDEVPFAVDDLTSTQRIEATLGYVYKFNEGWRFALRGGVRIASNLDSKMVSDDWLYLAAAYAISDHLEDKTVENPYRLVLGLMYSTTPGRNYPLPFVNYHVEHEKWSYTLGVPKSNIHYSIAKKQKLQAFATMDNMFSNLQKNKVIQEQLAENISMINVLLGVGYEYYFTEHLRYYGYVAYSVYNEYRLRNNDRDKIYVIHDKNSVYFRTGIRLKF